MRYLSLYIFVLFIVLQSSTVLSKNIHQISEDKNKAVFFIYHHIGEDQYPNSNLQVEQFIAHIQELKSSEYHVLPIPIIITALKSGLPMPQHTIGITLEGAYRSTFNNAIPLLLKAKLPFTLFIAPKRIDRNGSYYMNWKEIKKLSKNNLVTIGALPFSYDHISNMSKSMQQKQWSRSLSRFKEELKLTPTVFSWPYGEYTNELKNIMHEYPFKAGFAQHSGVAFHGSDILALPRFSMTELHGDLDRFRLATHSFPFPTSDDKPETVILKNDIESISFNLPEELKDKKGLACFISDLGKVNFSQTKLGKVSIKLDEPLSEKRIRMNCTLPLFSSIEKDAPQYWRWYGRLFVRKEETTEN